MNPNDHRREPFWSAPDGKPIGCHEKIKVLNENHAELRQVAQDALEDALLMGCSEDQVRLALHRLIDELHNPYANDESRTTTADFQSRAPIDPQ
jgi:hypothetical protein